MHKRQPKPGQIGDFWLSKKPGRQGADDAWCRTWYNGKSRQTCHISLGTADFHEASTALADWVVLNSRPQNARRDLASIDHILLSYWEDHGKFVSSPKTLQAELARWQEYWGGKTVDQITSNEQKRFRAWLGEGRLAKSTIDRFLSAGRAALNYAVRHGHLESAPHIFLIETDGDKMSRPPMGDALDVDEMARLIDHIAHPNLLMFAMIAANTLARPAAILDLGPAQFDAENHRLELNPKGRIQTKKFRPVLPVTATLHRWLASHGEDAPYVNVHGRRISDTRFIWKATVARAGLTEKHVTPYSFRHGMARQMRLRGISLEELGTFMGHKHKGSMATTVIYAPDDPAYLKNAAHAIEDVMAEIRKRLTKINIDLPEAPFLCGHIDGEPGIEGPGHAVGYRKRSRLAPTQRKELHMLIRTGKFKGAELARKFGISSTAVYKHMKLLGMPRK